jgi:hypothetical protein
VNSPICGNCGQPEWEHYDAINETGGCDGVSYIKRACDIARQALENTEEPVVE